MHISFSFPVKDDVMGGAKKIIIDLIAWYSQSNLKIDVRLYDYKDGLIKRKLDELGVNNYDYVEIDYDSKYINNKGDEVFVLMHANFVVFSGLLKNKNVKLLLWDLYYPYWNNFYKIKNIISIKFIKRKYVELLYENNSVVFMEEKGLRTFERMVGNKYCGDSIIYVPVNGCDKSWGIKRGVDNVLTIGYMGRAVYWKVTPIVKVASDLSKSRNKYNLIIFTDQKELYDRYMPDSPNLKIVYKLGCFGKELKEYIINNIDIGVAMGLSAIEFAKYGIPTILADPSYEPIRSKKYCKWIYEAELGNLGSEMSNSQEKDSVCSKDINRLINDYYENPEYYGDKSYDYVVNNYSIEKSAKKLMQYAYAAQLTPREITRYIYMFFYAIKKIKTAFDGKKMHEV